MSEKGKFHHKLVSRLGPIAIAINTLLASGEVEAKSTPDVCKITRGKTGETLKAICNEKGPMKDAETRMTMLEGFRNAEAFDELGKYLDPSTKDPNTRKFLYPGSGNHIATLVMASKLIDAGDIKAAEITLTETDECTRAELIGNLTNLPTIDKNYNFDPNKKTTETCADGAGQITNFVLDYKGHPITVNFLLNCSGDDYYRKTDFDKSDTLVLHDSSGDIADDILYLVSEYFKSQRKNKASGPSNIVMEDLTRSNEADYFERQFDLELLGTVKRGKNPYGHRENIKSEVDQFTSTQACRVTQQIEEFSLKYKKEDVKKWEETGTVPESYMTMNTETGTHRYKNGVVMKPHSALLQLDPTLTDLLMEISIAGNNDNTYTHGSNVKDRLRLNPSEQGKTPDLFSTSFLKDLFKNGQKIFAVIETVNPKLAQGLAIRVAQILLKSEANLIPDYVKKNYPNNPDQGFKEILTFFDSVAIHLNSAPEKTRKDIAMVKAYLENHQKGYILWQEYNTALELHRNRDSLSDTTRKPMEKAEMDWKKSLGIQEEEREKMAKGMSKYADRVFEKVSN